MADYTENGFEDSFNSRVRESNNTTTNNSTTNVGVDLDEVGNVDSSTNDSGNVALGLEGVGNTDSHDMSTGIDGSYNDWSDNSVDDNSDNSTEDNSDNSVDDNSDNSTHDLSDNSINGSYNDESSSLVAGSYNTYTDESIDDHSIDVGMRDYSTGIGNLGLSGGGGAGDVWVNNQNTIVDQSFNASLDGADAYGAAGGGSSAVVASGAGSMAAGNDVNLSQSVDESTTISGQGDVNIGNDTRITTITDSYNETVDSSSWTDSSTHLDVDESYNADTASWTATNSFNEELTSQSTETWDVDADLIWGSEDVAIGETPVDAGFDAS